MATNPLNVTSLSNTQLKQSLIEFIEAKPEWSNVDYEGSAINTIADLLVYNAQKTGYQANMVANESFLDTAQIRANVVSHAQKLSYVPKSTTAARLECDIEVTPPQGVPPQSSIVMEAGTPFIAQSEDESFTFINKESYVLNYVDGVYRATGVALYQGQLIEESYPHIPESRINIQNTNADNTTIQVVVDGSAYTKADSIEILGQDSKVFFLGENLYRQSQIEFGRNILGNEPQADANVRITYIATEDNHANGLSDVIAAGQISNFNNISVNVTTPAYGGSDRENTERVRFLAPKIYQAQDRALTSFDYVPLLMQEFPFIQSAIAWGGEDNDPPMYGMAFVSILSEGELTRSIKNQMKTFLRNKNVGSITPNIVDPEHFYCDLNILFSYDSRATTKTFNDLKTQITTVVENYNEELVNFDQFLNPSEIITRIKDISGITSVDIEKVVYSNLDILSFENPSYTVNFANPIEPNSVGSRGDISIADGASDSQLYDDGEGNVIHSYVDINGSTIINNVGSVDYDSGLVELTLNIISGESEFSISMIPQNDNVYMVHNKIIEIVATTYELIETKTRSTGTFQGGV